MKKFELTFYPQKESEHIFEKFVMKFPSKEKAYEHAKAFAKEKGWRLVDIHEFKNHKKVKHAPATSTP